MKSIHDALQELGKVGGNGEWPRLVQCAGLRMSTSGLGDREAARESLGGERCTGLVPLQRV